MKNVVGEGLIIIITIRTLPYHSLFLFSFCIIVTMTAIGRYVSATNQSISSMYSDSVGLSRALRIATVADRVHIK